MAEIKAQKDIEHTLFNFVMFLERDKDGSELLMKKYLLDLCVIEVLKLEDKSIGTGLEKVLSN